MSREEALDFYKKIQQEFSKDLFKLKKLSEALTAFYPNFYKDISGLQVSATPKSAPTNQSLKGEVVSMTTLFGVTNEKKTTSTTTSVNQVEKESNVPVVASNEEVALGVKKHTLKKIEYTFDLDQLKNMDLDGWIEFFNRGEDYNQMLAFCIVTGMKALKAKSSVAVKVDLVNDLFVHFQEKYLNANKG